MFPRNQKNQSSFCTDPQWQENTDNPAPKRRISRAITNAKKKKIQILKEADSGNSSFQTKANGNGRRSPSSLTV